MPILGDRLGVFLRYDDGSEAPIEWSVYAGGIEGSSRYYRIHYVHTNGASDTFDTTIDVDAAEAPLRGSLEAYRTRIHDWMRGHAALSAGCMDAIRTLFAEDPWMSYSSACALNEVD